MQWLSEELGTANGSCIGCFKDILECHSESACHWLFNCPVVAGLWPLDVKNDPFRFPSGQIATAMHGKLDCMEAMGIGHRQLDPKNGISHRSSVGSQSTNSVRRGREEKPQEKPTQEQEEVREENEFREEVQARRCMIISAAAVQGFTDSHFEHLALLKAVP